VSISPFLADFLALIVALDRNANRTPKRMQFQVQLPFTALTLFLVIISFFALLTYFLVSTAVTGTATETLTVF